MSIYGSRAQLNDKKFKRILTTWLKPIKKTHHCKRAYDPFIGRELNRG